MADATFTVSATTVTFKLLLDGAGPEQTAAVSVEHIPGGNVNYYDLGGIEAPTLKGRIKLATFADLVSLMTTLGQSGTLTYSEATYTAILRSVSRSRALGTGVSIAAVDFVIVV